MLPLWFVVLLASASFLPSKAAHVEGDDANPAHQLVAKMSEMQDRPGDANGVKVIPLKVMSFNLEGRGGNLNQPGGNETREALLAYMAGLCNLLPHGDTPGDSQVHEETRPDIILTQEDISAEISPCYQELARCESEEYWWNRPGEDGRFGDGGKMLNKVYIHTGSQFKVEKSKAVVLTTQSLLDAGLNPRCAAIVTLSADGVKFSVASFHLSGGYVDDNVIIDAVRRKGKTSFGNIRGNELALIYQALPGDAQLIMGGDTNGFVPGQVTGCQNDRIDYVLKPLWEDMTEADWTGSKKPIGRKEMRGIRNRFRAYIEVPGTVGRCTQEQLRHHDWGYGPCKGWVPRVIRRMPYVAVGACPPWSHSTTVWGGEPDQFYSTLETDVWNDPKHKYGISKVLAVGLGNSDSGQPPYPRSISDHNPIVLETYLRR